MNVKFPNRSELPLRDDPMAKMRECLRIHTADGLKKYIWLLTISLKVFYLALRSVSVLQCLDQPRRIIDLTALFPVAIMAVLKLSYLYIEKNRVDYLYDTINTKFWDYRICGREIEKKALGIFSFTNRMMLSHAVATATCVALIIAFPVADMPSESDRRLPVVIWAPFDLNPSPVHEIVYVVLFLNGVFTAIGNIVYDFFYVYCVQHLYVQFILLKKLLANITEGVMINSTDVEKFQSEYFQKTIMDRLKVCSEHHYRLLKYGKNIEIYCSKVLIPQLIMTYASLVVNGFVLTSDDRGSFSKSVAMFNLSLSTLIQICLFALLSSQLNEQSLSVIDAVYAAKWYLFNAPMKKACTFMMMNAERGIVIKAGGSTKIDNPLVVSILQNVFSAITLMKALIEATE